MSLGRLPLRITLPAGIFVIGVAVLGAYFVAQYQALEERVRRDAQNELRLIAALTAGDLENAFRKGEVQDARAAIERLSGARHVDSALLVNDSGEVLFATNPRLLEQGLETLIERVDGERIAAILQARNIRIVELEGGLVQLGFFPVRRRGSADSFLPTELTWLVVELNVASTAAMRQQQLLLRTIPYAVVLLVVCLGLWWFIRRMVLRRIQQLIEATRAVAMGDFSAQPNVGGRDEITELANAFTHMAHRLEHNTEELLYLSQHDRATGLYNRRGLEAALSQAVDEASRGDGHHLLVYMDLDSFRVVNDTQGHDAGDALIEAFAGHLSQHLSRGDLLARMGGDEFAVLTDHPDGSDAGAVAEALRRQAAELRFEWDATPYAVKLSAGAVVITGEAPPAEVLSQADTACYAAKERGGNRVQVWRSDESELIAQHGLMRWVGRIQAALEGDRFELHAQRIMPLQGEPTRSHFEVLVRMRDENQRLVPPASFLPAAERYHLANQIDRWVIDHTFSLLRQCGEAVREIGTCSINLSGLSLGDGELLRFIEAELARSPHLRSHQLCFEVTETAAITNLAEAVRMIRGLRALGCRLALDDFGSGLSSFGYLKNLDVDLIKIDGMFVRDMGNDPLDRVIVRSINDIAHEMGKHTVAEFAENRRITRELGKLGVDYAQGYGIHRPEPLGRLIAPLLPGRVG